MARLALSTTTDAEGAALLASPRDDVVLERETEPGRMEAVDGPFRSYQRTITVTPAADGAVQVDQLLEFQLAVPVWGCCSPR